VKFYRPSPSPGVNPPSFGPVERNDAVTIYL
jgi:hypothetical protein